jgi:metal-responsive CopG/Arc/MetJ family transcriptional regulator
MMIVDGRTIKKESERCKAVSLTLPEKLIENIDSLRQVKDGDENIEFTRSYWIRKALESVVVKSAQMKALEKLGKD